MENKFLDIIIELINSGDNLIDAAETCGHDEEVRDWNRSMKKAIKFVGDSYSIRKKELDIIRKEAIVAREAAKEKKYLEKQRKEEAKVLEQFGSSDLNELIYGEK